ncbi:MAG: response regulator transcription factor [Nitrospirae bacterium]|nr:response regulator transcription factor [Nitrospirota bacterium]
MDTGKVLIIEDESKIADVVKSYLQREGFSVTAVLTGEAGIREIKNGYDLVILDLKLPDIDGETVCKMIRDVTDIPVIMLTAKSSEDDRVKGLSLGADDYVVKPFSARELTARVKAHLRRSKRDDKKELSFNNGLLIIDTQSREVRKNGQRVALTNTEFRVLLSLAERPNVIFSRLQLINIVQGIDFDGFDRVVDVHIKNIRHKIEDALKKTVFIETVYGVGYKFTGEPDR